MRLIDVQPVLDYSHNKNIRACTVDLLEALPVVDAVPVVRGEWIHGCSDGAGTEFCFCSECSEDALKDKDGYTEFSAYCPNCGARMDGEP